MTTTNDTTAQPATISAAQLIERLGTDPRGRDATAEQLMLAHLVRTTWDSLQRFEVANREIERCRDRIARECAGLNCRRDSDCVSMAWISSAATDMAAAIEQRNAAYRSALGGLTILFKVGFLDDLMVPDFNA